MTRSDSRWSESSAGGFSSTKRGPRVLDRELVESDLGRGGRGGGRRLLRGFGRALGEGLGGQEVDAGHTERAVGEPRHVAADAAEEDARDLDAVARELPHVDEEGVERERLAAVGRERDALERH